MDGFTSDEATPPIRGIELVTRNSIHSLRAPSLSSNVSFFSNDNYVWNLSDLRKRFKNKDLEKLYSRYQQRLMHVDLKAYLLLQLFISFFFVLTLLILNREDESKVIPEAIAHTCLFLTAVMFYGVAYRETTFKKYKLLYIVTAICLIAMLVLVDLGQDLWLIKYNSNSTSSNVIVFHVPSSLYTIFVIYNLLPIASIRVAILCGLIVSVINLITSALWFQPATSTAIHGTDKLLVGAEVVLYVTINVVGVFTKYLNETTLRRAFLDKRKCIETTIKLDYEKRQEEQLMLSILPQHIAQEVSTDIREEVQQQTSKTPTSKKPFDKLHVEIHPEVSVLFADIINFTALTAKLAAGDLVAMLNELFGKFDEAARENNCLRIKILGDCYYCVSGIPNSTDQHAKNCVEMGFQMINIISQVREDHQVDVDMRIGVHSGSVISGLIGIRKWQFDIWSRDVTIANHMEQSGKAGRIHVSKATMDLLGTAYRYEPGNGKWRDPYLAKLGIETFLIVPKRPNHQQNGERKIHFPSEPFATLPRVNASAKPPIESSSQSETTQDDARPPSLDSLYERLPSPLPVVTHSRVQPTTSLPHIFTKTRETRRVSIAVGEEHSDEIYSRARNVRKLSAASGTERKVLAKRRSTATENNVRRGAVLMDNTLVDFRQMMDQADTKMASAIESIRLSKFRPQSLKTNEQHVNICLLFTNRTWELPFLLEPDPLFKLYILGAIPVLIGIVLIQLILYQNGPLPFWLAFGAAVIVIAVTGVFLWVPRMWQSSLNSMERQPLDSIESISYSPEPSRSSTSTISVTCAKVESLCATVAARIGIFLLVTVAVEACGLIDLEYTFNHLYYNASLLSNNVTEHRGQCVFQDPRIYLWYFTHMCALVMVVAFGFYRIHFAMKFTFYVATLTTYSLLIFDVYSDMCVYFQEDCNLCSPSLTFRPEVSHVMYLAMIVLLLHVADRQIEFIYRLDYVWQRQLASERQEANTTRMVNKMLLLNILPLHVAELYLDTFRCSDTLYHEEHKQVAVMFACITNFMEYFTENDEGDGGLQCLEILNSIISSFDALSYESQFTRIEKIKIVGSTYMAASGLTSIRKNSTETIANSESGFAALITMVRFAYSMKSVLDRLNEKMSLNFTLRTGIDFGSVIAGVVGAQKPLYDIWGNTVNVASRLEYTSQPGKIQVTEKTAKLLEREGVLCDKRGETMLKGKGCVMTYWVRMEETNFNYGMSHSMGRSSLRPGLSDLLLPASARSSFSRPPSRPSVLIEEDEEDVHKDSQRHLQPLTIELFMKKKRHSAIPRLTLDLFEESEKVSNCAEEDRSSSACENTDEVTYL